MEVTSGNVRPHVDVRPFKCQLLYLCVYSHRYVRWECERERKVCWLCLSSLLLAVCCLQFELELLWTSFL